MITVKITNLDTGTFEIIPANEVESYLLDRPGSRLKVDPMITILPEKSDEVIVWENEIEMLDTIEQYEKKYSCFSDLTEKGKIEAVNMIRNCETLGIAVPDQYIYDNCKTL
jgi:hypothetical protein